MICIMLTSMLKKKKKKKKKSRRLDMLKQKSTQDNYIKLCYITSIM